MAFIFRLKACTLLFISGSLSPSSFPARGLTKEAATCVCASPENDSVPFGLCCSSLVEPHLALLSRPKCLLRLEPSSFFFRRRFLRVELSLTGWSLLFALVLFTPAHSVHKLVQQYIEAPVTESKGLGVFTMCSLPPPDAFCSRRGCVRCQRAAASFLFPVPNRSGLNLFADRSIPEPKAKRRRKQCEGGGDTGRANDENQRPQLQTFVYVFTYQYNTTQIMLDCWTESGGLTELPTYVL